MAINFLCVWLSICIREGLRRKKRKVLKWWMKFHRWGLNTQKVLSSSIVFSLRHSLHATTKIWEKLWEKKLRKLDRRDIETEIMRVEILFSAKSHFENLEFVTVWQFSSSVVTFNSSLAWWTFVSYTMWYDLRLQNFLLDLIDPRPIFLEEHCLATVV